VRLIARCCPKDRTVTDGNLTRQSISRHVGIVYPHRRIRTTIVILWLRVMSLNQQSLSRVRGTSASMLHNISTTVSTRRRLRPRKFRWRFFFSQPPDITLLLVATWTATINVFFFLADQSKAIGKMVLSGHHRPFWISDAYLKERSTLGGVKRWELWEIRLVLSAW